MKSHPEHDIAEGYRAYASLRLVAADEAIEEPAGVSAEERGAFQRGLFWGIAFSLPVWGLALSLAWLVWR